MENEDHFYITLPSSASMDLHPNNVISDFTTELLNTIYVDTDKFEVGLSEIILDADVENVPGNQPAFDIYRNVEFVKNTLKIEDTSNLPTVRTLGGEYFYEMFSIEGGKYDSIAEILGFFNDRFITSRICRDLVFQAINQPRGDLELVTLKSLLSQDLHDQHAFSFEPYDWFQKSVRITDNPSLSKGDTFKKLLLHYTPTIEPYASESNTTFTNSLHFICIPAKLMLHPGMAYVYSDIVEQQYVGNTKASLCRVVHFPAGEKVISFPNVHYLTMSKSHLNSIRIYIRDVRGHPYPFTSGTAVCKVHIRRKLR